MNVRSVLERVDTWIGKTLFVPAIIRICQWVQASQYRFARICWFVAGLTGLYFATGWPSKIVFGIIAVICCLTSSLLPAYVPFTSARWFRLMVIAVILFMLPRWLSRGFDWHAPYYLLILFAEYAATIRTIPPLESKQAKRATVRARA